MTVQRVRVPSRWRDSLSFGSKRHFDNEGLADFALGVGPCGKTVERLDVHFHTHGVEIVQVCTCTERKVFVYPWHTITGRVEVTYG